MLQELLERDIPIAAVSGTSFGSVIGGFYGVLGPEGIDDLCRSWASLMVALSNTMLSTLPLAAWAAVKLGDAPLDELRVAVFPVGTLASTMTEWDVRGSTVAEGLRVSGSLPPFAPTIRGQLRLLDGGYAADVPCQVLVDEGIDLIIAVNPYPMPMPRMKPIIWIPVLSTICETLDPVLRMADTMRGYQVLWRFSSGRQDDLANVSYTASYSTATPFAFWQGQQIIAAARASAELINAAAAALDAWDALVGVPMEQDSGIRTGRR